MTTIASTQFGTVRDVAERYPQIFKSAEALEKRIARNASNAPPSFFIGRRRFFDMNAVEAWLRQQAEVGSPKTP